MWWQHFSSHAKATIITALYAAVLVYLVILPINTSLASVCFQYVQQCAYINTRLEMLHQTYWSYIHRPNTLIRYTYLKQMPHLYQQTLFYPKSCEKTMEFILIPTSLTVFSKLMLHYEFICLPQPTKSKYAMFLYATLMTQQSTHTYTSQWPLQNVWPQLPTLITPSRYSANSLGWPGVYGFSSDRSSLAMVSCSVSG